MIAHVEEALENWESGIEVPFVVIDRGSEEIVGLTRFEEVSFENRRLETGWTWYSKKVWGTGYIPTLRKKRNHRMQPWKLIALDLDGTLLDRYGKVSAMNRKCLTQLQLAGIVVTFVTGRHVSTVMPIVKELQLKIPVITSNGCEIWSSEGKLIKRTHLSTEQVTWIHAWAESNQLSYRAYLSDAVHDWEPDKGEEIHPVSGDWLKVLLKHRGGSRSLSELYSEARNSELFTVVGYKRGDDMSVTALDLHLHGVNKEVALQSLCNQLGIVREEVIAFGDDANDVQMLRWAGLGVAMGNAPSSVHQAADRIAPHHDEDGVATILRELFVI